MTGITLLIALAGGVLLGALCVIAGAWMAFRVRRVPGEGAGFVKDPKGQAFSIPDAGSMDFPDEPGIDEKNVLQRAERFLGSLGHG
jgi:hypothetical protein